MDLVTNGKKHFTAPYLNLFILTGTDPDSPRFEHRSPLQTAQGPNDLELRTSVKITNNHDRLLSAFEINYQDDVN